MSTALGRIDGPQIFNTDQGSQFTSDDFTNILKKHDIKISMDGQGRWMDNVFVERLWKGVKYEDIYLKACASITEVRKGVTAWFDRYNKQRRHQGLDDRTTDESIGARRLRRGTQCEARAAHHLRPAVRCQG